MEPFQITPIPDTPKGKHKEIKHKILFFSPSFSSHSSSFKLSIYFFITSVSLLITLFQIQLLKNPLSRSHLLSITFLPLKDLNFASTPMDGNTWFMSSLNDTFEDGEAEHLLFPSPSSHHNLLCLSGRDRSNGTKNSYALAPRHSLPNGAMFFKGLTFISDSYYDYENLWHGLAAMVPFMAWHSTKGCEKPERWLLYHWGELRVGMSPWVKMLVEAVMMGEKVMIEDLKETGGGSFCFERAVVFRHNEGEMRMERKKMVYDMMRCKARAFCRLGSGGGEGDGMVRVTLLMRNGARSFKDERTVVKIFDRECGKVEGCRLKVIRPNNLTFCDQVKLMTETDILASPHGAQLTNMLFMNKNSGVMEFFPKGWKEFAGVGQYVFRWIANAAGIKHLGPWHDSNGDDQCPYNDNSKCFGFYKNGRIGHDEAYFTDWTAKVLREMRDYKLTEEYRYAQQELRARKCLCAS
ncbi:hypothetical protein M5K25_023590 [Dendrobium thyrsiflorum]|uniref:Glycosyltransferase 61 catalytic domain-containing protein n=1 Tax=Dendrobium thyrsiflorum TaxID=117978 RepID=A0ABD0UFC0_DENTH